MRDRRDGDRIAFHQVADVKFGQLPPVIADALALQGLSINGTAFDADRGVIADDAGEHERKDDFIIEGQLEDHDDGHDRGVSRGGEERAHPNQSEGAGIKTQMAREKLENAREKETEASPDEKGGCKDAADRAGAEGNGRRENLENE